MTKYHISPKSGRPNICRADKQECPLKSDDGKPAPHFTDKSEAKAYAEGMLTEEHGALSVIVKKKPENKKTSKVKTSNKEVNQEAEEKRERNTLSTPIQRPRVEEIPDNAIKILQNKERSVPSLSKKQEKKLDADVALVLDKNVGIDEKKELLKNHLTTPEKRDEIAARFTEQGYSLEDSSIYSALLNNETGVNLTLRNAIRETESNGETTLSDVLINAEEASYSQNNSYSSDRFSEFTYSDKELTLEDLDNDTEEAPDFLADDPDFAIDEDDDDFDDED